MLSRSSSAMMSQSTLSCCSGPFRFNDLSHSTIQQLPIIVFSGAGYLSTAPRLSQIVCTAHQRNVYTTALSGLQGRSPRLSDGTINGLLHPPSTTRSLCCCHKKQKGRYASAILLRMYDTCKTSSFCDGARLNTYALRSSVEILVCYLHPGADQIERSQQFSLAE